MLTFSSFLKNIGSNVLSGFPLFALIAVFILFRFNVAYATSDSTAIPPTVAYQAITAYTLGTYQGWGPFFGTQVISPTCPKDWYAQAVVTPIDGGSAWNSACVLMSIWSQASITQSGSAASGGSYSISAYSLGLLTDSSSGSCTGNLPQVFWCNTPIGRLPCIYYSFVVTVSCIPANKFVPTSSGSGGSSYLQTF